jgi:hypothetical protein
VQGAYEPELLHENAVSRFATADTQLCREFNALASMLQLFVNGAVSGSPAQLCMPRSFKALKLHPGVFGSNAPHAMHIGRKRAAPSTPTVRVIPRRTTPFTKNCLAAPLRLLPVMLAPAQVRRLSISDPFYSRICRPGGSLIGADLFRGSALAPPLLVCLLLQWLECDQGWRLSPVRTCARWLAMLPPALKRRSASSDQTQTTTLLKIQTAIRLCRGGCFYCGAIRTGKPVGLAVGTTYFLIFATQ